MKTFSDPERELPTLPNVRFSLFYAPKHVQDPREHTSAAAQLTGKPNFRRFIFSALEPVWSLRRKLQFLQEREEAKF